MVLKLLTLKDAQVLDLDKFEYSPHSKWLMEDMMDLGIRIGLVDPSNLHSVRYFRGVVDLSVHTYWYAPRRAFRLATLWSTWLFYIDDQYDESKEFGTNIERVRQLMEDCLVLVKTGKAPEDSPFWRLGLAFYEAMDELLPSEEVHWRMVEIVARYFFRGAIEQMKYWRDGVVPTFEEFEERRMYDSATLPCEIMVELCGDAVLPTSLFHDPRVDKLKSLWARQIALLNDIYSYDKEVLKVGTDWNLLRVYMHHSNPPLSLEEAIDKAIRYINSLSAEFEQVGHELIDEPTTKEYADVLERYVYAMRQWMVGHIVHSNDTYRYSDPLDTKPKKYKLPPYLRARS